MDTNRMRLGLAYIFKESTQIGKTAKIQLLNFIEQANEHQLKVLALDGEIVHSKMFDESTKEIVDERFEASQHIIESLKKASLQGLNELAKKKSVIKEESVLAIIKTYGLDASKKYNACMAKAKKEKWFSKNRSLAVALCKQQDYAYNAQQRMKNIGMCKKAKDPEKCKKHVKQMAFVNKSEADKYGAKVNKLKAKINESAEGLNEANLQSKLQKTIDHLNYYKKVKSQCKKTEKTPEDVRGCLATADEYIARYNKIIQQLKAKMNK